MLIKDFSNIELKGSDGKSYKLSKFKGKYIVLYFYPKDNTPGCTIQGHEYTKMLADFKKHNAVVIGVSKGTENEKTEFANRQCFKHLLLADSNFNLAQAFHVTKPGFFGKGISLKRSSFIISPTQTVISERICVNPKNDALENLQFLMNVKEEA